MHQGCAGHPVWAWVSRVHIEGVRQPRVRGPACMCINGACQGRRGHGHGREHCERG
jgi:hypothetical protein